MSDVTLLLAAANQGEPGARERLWETVYGELRRLAGAQMAREGRQVTLQATVLVHEVWLRLAAPESDPQSFVGRAHFFAAAGEAMRRILVDQARRRLSQKRGGGHTHLSVDAIGNVAGPSDQKLLQVHEVLDDLEKAAPQKAQIVKLRYFSGFTHQEIATMLDVSEKTVRREWNAAKLWLFTALKAAGLGGAPVQDTP